MKPKKTGERMKTDHVKTVTNHRLAEGHHSHVFPEHIGENHWHQGARNGHLGAHQSPSKHKRSSSVSRVSIPPKYVTETRGDRLDFSPFLQAGVTVASAVAVVTVWSGTDPTPTLVVTPVAASPIVTATCSGGVLGVIYYITVRATLSSGEIIPLSYYLAVVPDTP